MEIWDGIGWPVPTSAQCSGGALGSISGGSKRKAWSFLTAKNETSKDERTHFMTCDAVKVDKNHPKGKLQCWGYPFSLFHCLELGRMWQNEGTKSLHPCEAEARALPQSPFKGWS